MTASTGHGPNGDQPSDGPEGSSGAVGPGRLRENPPAGTSRPEKLVDLLNHSTATVYRAASGPEWAVVAGAGDAAVEALERLKEALTLAHSHSYPPTFRERIDSVLYAVKYVSPRYAKDAVDELVKDFNRYWGPER